MTRTHLWIVGRVFVVGGLLSVCLFDATNLRAQTATWMPAVAAIPSPAAANTGEPQFTTSNRGVLLSWIEHAGNKTSLKFAERTHNGWTPTRTVASGDDWSLNGIDVPTILRLSNGTLVAQWLRTSGGGMHTNDVSLSYSKDEGRSWARSFAPYRDQGPTQRLFPSLFEMPTGGLGLIWLTGGVMSPTAGGAGQRDDSSHTRGTDHRQQPGAGRQGHEGHEMPGATAGNMALRFAAFDGGWKPIAEMPVDPRVCECCSTAAVVTSDGVLAAYRNRSDDEIRDIYVSRLAEGRWSDPTVVHADNWHIAACPINGPALSANGRNVAIAWYTIKQDQGHAYLAFSRDAGRNFGAPIQLDDRASLGRVDVAVLGDGSALATWIEVADGGSQFRARRIASDGARSNAVTVTTLAGSRTSPRVAYSGDEVILAWTETMGSESRVRTAVVSVPNSGRR